MENKLKRKQLFIVCCFFSGLMLIGCHSTKQIAKSDPGPEKQRMANPAAQQCITQGYTLEPIMQGGVPTDHMCVNLKNNQRCEVWRFYRGECRLD